MILVSPMKLRLGSLARRSLKPPREGVTIRPPASGIDASALVEIVNIAILDFPKAVVKSTPKSSKYTNMANEFTEPVEM